MDRKTWPARLRAEAESGAIEDRSATGGKRQRREQQLLLDEKRINNGLLATADKRPVRRLWLSFEGAVQTLLDLLAL